ncbi:MAG: hypothetical protein L6R42_011144, partial [Xanthoria sp. 1 TBL-2021]
VLKHTRIWNAASINSEVRERERDEKFAQKRRLAEDAQRQYNENAEKQHNEALENNRRQDENTRRLMMALDSERRQHGYTQRQNEIQQQRHETQLQRRDDDTAQQLQRLESLQEQVSNLTHTLSNPPSPRTFSTIPNSQDEDKDSAEANDDDLPSSPDHSDTPDYDEDWKLEAVRRERASRERSLALGAPLLIAVSGPADPNTEASPVVRYGLGLSINPIFPEPAEDTECCPILNIIPFDSVDTLRDNS